MYCEIEFLPVGDASKAGDAIVVRYGTPDRYELMIVDAGFAETGPQVVEHIRSHFGDHPISHVVLTHPDQDHAGGLRHVLTELNVGAFWLNMPWDVDDSVLPFYADKTLTEDVLRQKLVEEYDLLAELVVIALRKDIPIRDAVAGAAIGPFRVLSPTREIFRLLVPQFDRGPAPDEAALQAVNALLQKPYRPGAFGAVFQQAAAAIQNMFTESWAVERLKDGGRTSASNESSVVLYGHDHRGPVLLTGDAGIVALTMAADNAGRLVYRPA